MRTYRRRSGHDTWHFCRNCHLWPTVDYIERTQLTPPTTGELCNHCRAKVSLGFCIN